MFVYSRYFRWRDCGIVGVDCSWFSSALGFGCLFLRIECCIIWGSFSGLERKVILEMSLFFLVFWGCRNRVL